MSRLEEALEKAMAKRQSIHAPTDTKGDTDKVRPIIARKKELFKGKSSVSGKNVRHINITNPYLVTATDPDSPVSEEYRKLKSMVVKLTKMDDFNNTILITSALGGEGKSLTALNLAITLAHEYDHTVLLVDVDFRQPSVHKYLNIDVEAGLGDCLLEGIDLSEAIIKTDIGKLSILPAGKHITNPVEILLSERMKEIVTELKERYTDRYIIFDAPPVLPFAETHHLASLVDGVIFVIKEGHAPVKSINESINMLKDSKILGIVYNNAYVDRFDGRYYYYYKNSYGERE